MEKHSEILPQLAAFHDGQLDAQDRLRIESHVQVCPFCRRTLEDWQALDRALLELPVPETAASDLYRRTAAALSARAARARPVLVSVGSRVRLWATAAVLMFVAVTAVMWQREAERTVAQADRMRVEPKAPSSTEAAVGELATQEPSAESYDSLPALPGEIIPAAPQPVGAGDSGIPQPPDWRARLLEAEYAALARLRTGLRLKLEAEMPPQRIVEINLLPLFEADFVPVGYKPLEPALNPTHEAAYSDPVLLTPETAYLVSNLRLEQTSLLARSHEDGPTADVTLKLAEITWRLANITADRDDVKSAIAALNLAARQKPDMAAVAETRISELRALYGE